MRRLIAANGGFLNVSDAKFREWKEKYPGVDIDKELQKANKWLEKNPTRMWKTLRGFENWLDSTKSYKTEPLTQTIGYEESKHYAVVAEKYSELPVDGKRASEDDVRRLMSSLMASLIPDGIPEPESPVAPCRHEWRRAFYVPQDWCTKCGTYASQMSDDFDRLIAIARAR